MPSRRNRRFVQHLFDGGWASDLGPNAGGLRPDRDGNVRVPFLIEAEDLLFELNGGVRKAPGTAKLNASQISGAPTIAGLFDYWRMGTGGTSVQKRVIHAGTVIYKDDADGTWDSLATGLTDGAVPNYSTFDDLLIIASDSSDVPRSWDQTTFQNLAGSPPNFAFSVKHKNFHFAAGVDANPSRLYYSGQLDPESWTGGTSGNIDIDPDDGDRITGLISWKNELWVFKGPNKGSIHRITGSSNSDWARTTFIEGVGAAWQNSIFRLGDDIGFLWTDGSVRTLRATDAFGDYRERSLSWPIQTHIDAHLNFAQLRRIQVTPGPAGTRIYFSVATDSSATNNEIWALDVRFDPPRWSRVRLVAPAIALVYESNVPTVMVGGTDGYVRTWDQAARSNDGTGWSFRATTPFLDYGNPHQMKTLATVALGTRVRTAGDITFGWARDNAVEQTQAIGMSDTAGVALDTFLLDTDSLAGSLFLNRYADLPTSGEFRSVQYSFRNAVDSQDVEMHDFSIGMERGAESLE